MQIICTRGKRAQAEKRVVMVFIFLNACDVKKLQEELRKAQLHNKLLNAIIDIAEDQLKIDIRKKSGTKQ
jgi:hypothetical protein